MLARLAGLSAVVALAACAAPSQAVPGPRQVSVPAAGPASNEATVRLTSIRARRFLTTVRQRTDYSCGSAAIATLLTYHYLLPTSEEEVLASMTAHGDAARIQSEGFSLLDMQNYLARRGLRAAGFRAPLDRLAQARVPSITLIDVGGYRHFVVLRGIEAERVLLADPNRGTRVMRRAAFERAWNGIAFVLLDRPEFARATFGRAEDWGVLPRAPIAATRGTLDGLSVSHEAFNGRFF